MQSKDTTFRKKELNAPSTAGYAGGMGGFAKNLPDSLLAAWLLLVHDVRTACDRPQRLVVESGLQHSKITTTQQLFSAAFDMNNRTTNLKDARGILNRRFTIQSDSGDARRKIGEYTAEQPNWFSRKENLQDEFPPGDERWTIPLPTYFASWDNTVHLFGGRIALRAPR